VIRSVKNLRHAAVLLALAALAGCVSQAEVDTFSARDAGFHNIALVTEDAVSKDTVFIQDSEEATTVSSRVKSLVRGRTVDVETAVQVALLNNRGLQAAYTDVGISAAEAWQQTMLPNPRVSIGVFGIAHPELGAFRAIEGMIANNILAMLTQRQRVDIADAQFQRAQLVAINETLRVAMETRRAWYEAVGAFERVIYLNQAQTAANAASELARKLGESGALPKAGQAREHAFFAELTAQKAKARLAAKLAKEELARNMGLWGDDLDFFVPDYLPRLPARPPNKGRVEGEALQRRVDLMAAKLELEAQARSFGLTDATRYVTDLELLAGFEKELEIEDGDKKHVTTGQVEIEFVLPIFDSGKARLRKAELTYMRAANLLAEKAVNVRSQARSALLAVQANHDIARHYQNAVLPLRTVIQEEALLTYNGMITNTFELLADTRARVNTVLMATDARRDFWLADTNLSAAIYGGGGQIEGGDAEAAVADAGPGGH